MDSLKALKLCPCCLLPLCCGREQRDEASQAGGVADPPAAWAVMHFIWRFFVSRWLRHWVFGA